MKKIIVMILSMILMISALGCSSEDTDGDTAETSAPADAGALGAYEVVIKDYQILKDYDGNDAIAISYDFTNNGEDAMSFSVAILSTVFQDGIELDYTSVYENEDDFTTLDESTMTEIQPGKTLEVMTTHKLNDLTNPVEVEVEELISFSEDKLTKTFEIAQ